MSAWRHFRRGLANLISGRRAARDEAAHYVAEARAAGLPAGDEERWRDHLRTYGWENSLSAAAADLRYAARQLRHSPAFTLAAVVVLALGIGVGTAMFSVLSAVLLRPLPYAQPGQLVSVTEPSSMAPVFWASSHPDIEDWRQDSRSFQSLAYYQWGMATLEGQQDSLEVSSFQASPNLFATLGRLPLRGRAFTPADITAHAKVVVLSWNLWQKWFHGQPALGRSVRLNGAAYSVVGILPRGLVFPYDGQAADLWTPYVPPHPDPRDSFQLHVIARLRPGVRVAAAQAELSAIQARTAREYANLHLSNHVQIVRYADSLAGSVRPALWALALAVALVWLIACASVAGLMLTRLATRRRELAVRSALGAGRLRLARQLLSESLLLGVLAGAVGWALAALCLAGLRAFVLAHLTLPVSLSMSTPVLAALLAASLLSVILIGLAPAWGASRIPAAEGLQDRSLGLGRAQTRLRHALVIGEISLALLLLSGAGLFLRTLYALGQVPLGFRTENILTTRLNIPSDLYAQRGIYQNLEQPLLAKLDAFPGLEASAISSVLPLGSAHIHLEGEFGIVGRPHLLRSEEPEGDMRYTSPDYPKVFAIPLLRGRFFNPSLDTPTSEPVAVINQAMARKYFAGENPVGQQLTIGPLQGATIVGVLADVHMQAVGSPPGPVVHFSTTQLAPHNGSAPFYGIGAQFVQLAVRSALPASTLAPEIRAALHALAPEVAPSTFVSEQQLVADSVGDQTFAAHLLSLFGLAALLIALAGLYGLLTYSVAQRRRELGIRLALGASPQQVRALVLGNAGVLIASGIAIGLVLALALAQVLASYLYGVAPRDPISLAAAALLLAACALLAAWLPARRAASIPVVETLRTN
ncbi:MAG: ADOP family duplicated permease [Terriglobales bacterium]